jgi:ribosome-associated protein
VIAKKATEPKTAGAKAIAPKVTKAKKAALVGLQVRDSATEVLDLILKRLDDMKAEETVTIDLRGKSAYSDYMVVTTGRSNRHVGSLAENVAKGLKESGNKKGDIDQRTY